MSRRFAKAGRPTGSEHILSANLVAHATPHTVGSWVEIDASVAQDCCGLWIASDTVIGVSATDTSMLLELGFGAAAAEQSQVQVFVGGAAANLFTYLPLHIPAGTRLSGRIQGVVTVDIYTPRVILEFARGRFGWGGYSVATALGLNAATSAPTTADLADNAFDQVIASTAAPYRALTVHLGVNVNAAVNTSATVDVAIGGAAAEVVLGTWVYQVLSTEILTAMAGPIFVECDVPTGTRISLRKNATTDLTGHVIGWR